MIQGWRNENRSYLVVGFVGTWRRYVGWLEFGWGVVGMS